MTSCKPEISVVMGCYNSAGTIREAIDSILHQTFSNFELIIIDDHSSDRTPEICRSYVDKRIVFIQNKENKGLGYSLNLGIRLSKGKYIARMDADDISHPHRLREQRNFMERHPHLICVGTRAKKIGNIGFLTKIFSGNINVPTKHEDIKAHLLLGTPMLHPSVMFNAELLKTTKLNYDVKFRKAQDYELWSRMIWLGEMANMKKKLLYYRYSSNQASSKDRTEQIKNSKDIYNKLLRILLNRELSEAELADHTLFATQNHLDEHELERVEKWMEFLIPYIKKSVYYKAYYIKKLFTLRRVVLYRNVHGFIHRIVRFFSNKYYSSFSVQIISRLFL